MTLQEQIAAVERQVAELFKQNRELTRQIQELAGREQTPQQTVDIRALSLRIQRDGWDAAFGKPARRTRTVRNTADPAQKVRP